MNKDIGYLKHAEEAARKILETYIPKSKEQFIAEEWRQLAVLRLYTVMGQAIKNLSVELRQQHPTILWKEFTGFRDILVHQYFSVDLNIVWKVSTEELPRVHAELKRLLSNYERPSGSS